MQIIFILNEIYFHMSGLNMFCIYMQNAFILE